MAVISVPTMAAMSAKFHGGTGAAINSPNRADVGLVGPGDGACGEFPDPGKRPSRRRCSSSRMAHLEMPQGARIILKSKEGARC